MITLIHRYPLSKNEKILLCQIFLHSLKIEPLAKTKKEKLFKDLYYKQLKKFLDDTKANLHFCYNALNEFDSIIESRSISTKQRESTLALRQQLIENYFYLFENDKLKSYDILEFENIFFANLSNLTKEMNLILPTFLLENIADLRVYCLGYATQENIDLLKNNFNLTIENIKNHD